MRAPRPPREGQRVEGRERVGVVQVHAGDRGERRLDLVVVVLAGLRDREDVRELKARLGDACLGDALCRLVHRRHPRSQGCAGTRVRRGEDEVVDSVEGVISLGESLLELKEYGRIDWRTTAATQMWKIARLELPRL